VISDLAHRAVEGACCCARAGRRPDEQGRPAARVASAIPSRRARPPVSRSRGGGTVPVEVEIIEAASLGSRRAERCSARLRHRRRPRDV